MKKLIKKVDAHSIEVLGADNKYHSVGIEWDENELSDRTREQVLATGIVLHLGLPVGSLKFELSTIPAIILPDTHSLS